VYRCNVLTIAAIVGALRERRPRVLLNAASKSCD